MDRKITVNRKSIEHLSEDFVKIEDTMAKIIDKLSGKINKIEINQKDHFLNDFKVKKVFKEVHKSLSVALDK